MNESQLGVCIVHNTYFRCNIMNWTGNRYEDFRYEDMNLGNIKALKSISIQDQVIGLLEGETISR